MQTIGKYDPPRNRSSYEYSFFPTLAPCSYWDAFNRSEYRTWAAIRCVRAFFNAEAEAERKAEIARARYFLAMARDYRLHCERSTSPRLPI